MTAVSCVSMCLLNFDSGLNDLPHWGHVCKSHGLMSPSLDAMRTQDSDMGAFAL